MQIGLILYDDVICQEKMAARREAFRVPGFGRLASLVALLAMCSLAYSRASAVEVITSENFDQLLTGDWMVEL